MKKLLSAIMFIVLVTYPLLIKPIQVDAAGMMFTSVSSHLGTTFALDANSHIWAWGSNISGQFGDGTLNSSNTPKQIVVMENGVPVLFKEVTASDNSALALDRDGHLWVTGDNGRGQLGLGTGISNVLVWTKADVIDMGTPVIFKKTAATRWSSAAIDSNGKLWVWGFRTNGGGNYNVPTKQSVNNGGTPVVFETMDMNEENGIAIDSMQNVWNIFFQLYNPSMYTIQQGGIDVQFKSIAAGSTYGTGYYFNVAIDANGNAWSWGSDAGAYQGQLGDGQPMGTNVPAVSNPTKISVMENGTPVKFKLITAGKKHVLALDENGDMWTWGLNDSGQLGDNTTVNSNVPHKVLVSDDGTLIQFSSLSAGNNISYGLDVNGRLWSWGAQQLLGDNTAGNGSQKVPKKILIKPQASLTTSVASSTYLQSITLTASIVGVFDTPSGVVEFKDGLNVLGSVPLAVNGTAQLNIATLQSGSHTLAANYKGDDIYLAESTGNLAFQVTMPAAPSVVIVPSTTSDTNDPVTLTVTAQTYGAGNSLASLKWLPGDKNAAAFASAGTDILAARSFEATSNGIYTAYAEDLAGNATVKKIQIANINSAISPTVASFDKYAGSATNVDITTTLTLNGNTLTSVVNGATILNPVTDYTVTGSTLTIKKAYLEAQPTGAASLTFAFSGGAARTLTIAVNDSTPNNSAISPAAASFDKYAGAAANVNVTTTLTLSGNTLSGIANGVTTLTLGTDYTVSGSTITILKTYLQAQPTGRASLTFTFSGGAAQTLLVAVNDSTPNNSAISPAAASFDKYAGAAANVDVTTTLTLSGNTLSGIANGATPLTLGTNYTLTGSTVTILKAYLQEQPIGRASLTFTFSGGAAQTLTIAVNDSTPNNSVISPAAVSFDKYAGAAANVDVTTTLTLSGNTLSGIANGATTLALGTDYTVTGSTVTILKAYLQEQPTGTASLTFAFSGGAAQMLTITVSDSTPIPSRNNSKSNSTPTSTAEPSKYQIITDPSGRIVIIVDPSVLVTETAWDGTSVQKLTLPDDILNQAAELLKDTLNSVITIRVMDTEPAVHVQLSGGSISALAKSFPNAVIQIELIGSSLELKASVLDLEGLAKRLGVAVSDLKIVTSMERVSDSVRTELERIGTYIGFQVLGSAIDFKVMVEANGQMVDIRDFGGTYMVRGIVYEAGSAKGNVIAVHYDPSSSTVSYIPTHLSLRENGKKEAVMKVPHYSIYAVVETNDRSFIDLNGHWAKTDVELLASKLIVNGVSADRFAADASITRAEFASLLVRSMGISTEHDTAYKGYTDVALTSWYAPAVEAAVKAGLVNGITADRFGPDERISREQMAVMIARALAITSVGENRQGDSQALAAFTDHGSISSWAETAVARSVNAGIITGLDGNRFAPMDFATRAQAATMLKRFLHTVGFIE